MVGINSSYPLFAPSKTVQTVRCVKNVKVDKIFTLHNMETSSIASKIFMITTAPRISYQDCKKEFKIVKILLIVTSLSTMSRADYSA